MGLLQPLLAPRSIAVIGDGVAELVVAQCVRIGFTGHVWPVHPTRTDMAGIECVGSIEQLPAPPDAAFVSLDPVATIAAIRSLAAAGTRGAVCHGAMTSGEVATRGDLIDAAGAMPFFGPDAHGFVNAFDRVALWPGEHGLVAIDDGAAIVTQSGHAGMTLAFQQRGLRLGAMVTVGDQACLGTEDAIDALLDDPRVTSIGLFIDTVKDAQRFAEVAVRAHDQEVPIVALHTGRPPRTGSSSASHTAAMDGRAAAYDALLVRSGIARVRTPTELVEALKLLDHGGPLAGHRVVSISSSRAEASLVSDRAASTNLVFERFDDDHRDRIAATFAGEPAGVSNPLTHPASIWGDRVAMARCFTAVMEGDQDATMLVLDAPTASGNDPARWLVAIDALGDAAQATGGRAVVVATLPECLDLRFREHVTGRGLTPLLGLTEALTALDAAGFAGTPPGPMHAPVTAPANTRTVDEAAAKARLRYLGLPVPDGRMVLRHDVASAAAEVGYPITIKGLGIAHKSEAGAVAVGVVDEAALLAVVDSMSDDMVRFLVESTVTDTVAEVLVAVRRDPPVGWLVTLGFGGVDTEIWQDVTHLLAPVTTNDVIAALARLRSAPLLTGFRGRPPADIGALARLVVEIVDNVVGTAAVELELNPVLVGRCGATIVDAFWIEEVPA